jgi:hypothetical protein
LKFIIKTLVLFGLVLFVFLSHYKLAGKLVREMILAKKLKK